jgi:hypothetical protein
MKAYIPSLSGSKNNFIDIVVERVVEVLVLKKLTLANILSRGKGSHIFADPHVEICLKAWEIFREENKHFTS